MNQRIAFLLLLSIGSAQSAITKSEPALLRSTNHHHHRDLSHQHRDLTFSSWWSTVLTAIHDAVHPPCPINEHDGTCDSKHTPFGVIGPACSCDSHHHKSGGSSSGSSGSSASASASSSSSSAAVESTSKSYVCVDGDGNEVSCSICTEDNGDEPCYPATDDAAQVVVDDATATDDAEQVVVDDATDDAENVVTDDAWKNDGYVPEEDDTPENVVTDDAWKNDGYVPEEDDTPENIVDDAWTADGWEQSNLSGASLASGNRSTPIWPFVLGAMVAGVMGAAFVVTRRKRRVEVDNEPLDGSVNSDFDDDRNISRDHEPSSGVEMNETKNKKRTSIFKKPRLGFVTKKSLLDDHSTAASSAYSRQV